MPESPRHFEWRRHPEAETWVADLLNGLVAELPALQAFPRGLLHAGSQLAEWLDHVILADGDRPRGQLRELGFEPEGVDAQAGDRVYYHPGAVFPRVVLRAAAGSEAGTPIGAFVQVDDIPSFLMAHRQPAPIEGTPLSPYRRATVWTQARREFGVVERRGHSGFVPVEMPPDYAMRTLRAYETWATRPRLFQHTLTGMEQTLDLAQHLAAEVGTDTAAWIALAAERAYWQQRNRAGQVQKARQDGMGLGWANQDHCAFRSSREVFSLLIQILETFGFRRRERFYAGAEAGWGAQVMEQAACRLALFCDVDLSPEEVDSDFASNPLGPRSQLDTIGLWCALHGESMLAAGTHHLAARLHFETVPGGLAEWGIKMMRPFSDFSYLRQAFTRGERWSVDRERLDQLAASGQISDEQRAQFAEKGALGSHMEVIQRGQGFKGFNQQMVSDIIRRTDPRLTEVGP